MMTSELFVARQVSRRKWVVETPSGDAVNCRTKKACLDRKAVLEARLVRRINDALSLVDG